MRIQKSGPLNFVVLKSPNPMPDKYCLHSFYVVLGGQFPLLHGKGGHQEGVYMGVVILKLLLLPFLLQATMHSYLNVYRDIYDFLPLKLFWLMYLYRELAHSVLVRVMMGIQNSFDFYQGGLQYTFFLGNEWRIGYWPTCWLTYSGGRDERYSSEDKQGGVKDEFFARKDKKNGFSSEWHRITLWGENTDII